MMGYLVAGSPFSLPSLTLPYIIDLPNISPGARLWIDNESGYVFTFSLGGRAPDLCPANYGRTLQLDGGSTRFEILTLIGSGSGSLSSNLFLYVITPDQKDLMDSARQPVSRYPTSQNYGFQVRLPNGGVYGSSQKNVNNNTPPVPTSKATQLDSLDFANVIFYEDWEGYNVATGSTYNLTNISGATSACGVPWGYGQPAAGMGYYNQLTMHYAGLPKTPPCIAQPAVSTTVYTPGLFPQFNFPISPSAIEMCMYGTMQLATTVGTLVTTYAYFMLNPTIDIGIQISGPGYTTSTIQAQAYQPYTNVNQSATFTGGTTAQGTTAVNFRIAIKALINTSGTYDIYCAFSVTTTLTSLPIKPAYTFVMTLNNNFPALLNLSPGFALQTIIGAGTTTTATSIDMGIYNNSASRANGLYPPCLQINIP